MNASRPSTILDPEDDAPDLSAPEWREILTSAPVRRGRPKLETPKVATTIRLDNDVVAFFRASGAGWQTRINDALRSYILGPKVKPASPTTAKRKVALRAKSAAKRAVLKKRA